MIRPVAIVTGMIATYPVGGVVWDYGQYALGLEALGYEVWYLEDTGSPTYDPRAGLYGDEPEYGVAFLADALAHLSPRLKDRWHFRAADGRTYGISTARLREVLGAAELLLNVSGGALLREETMVCPLKVLIDTDPGWNHFVNYPRWDQGKGWPGALGFRGHDRFFTYAERIGRPGCLLPELGLRWVPTRPPVALDRWAPRPPGETWTTVMTWNNFRRPVEHEGRIYGTKEMEFPRVEHLPARVAPVAVEIAVGGSEPPVDRWREFGWRVASSEAISRTAEDYRAYVEGSRGEVSVAKNLYTMTRSGWFSCRSACYLAAGRPVVVQDTGFSEILPTGEGLFAFENLEGAVAGIEAVEADYPRHAAAARAVAREHFEASRVVGRILAEVGLR